jgi:hypothetical protein
MLACSVSVTVFNMKLLPVLFSRQQKANWRICHELRYFNCYYHFKKRNNNTVAQESYLHFLLNVSENRKVSKHIRINRLTPPNPAAADHKQSARRR